MPKVRRPDLDENNDNDGTREVMAFLAERGGVASSQKPELQVSFDAFVSRVVSLASVRPLGEPALTHQQREQVRLNVLQALFFHNILDGQAQFHLDRLERLVDQEPLFEQYRSAYKKAIQQVKNR